MDPLTEIQKLFLKAAQNNMTLNHIDEIEALCLTFKDREDYKDVELEVKKTISTIYSLNKLYEQAFAIDLELLTITPVNYPRYWGLIYSATFNSTALNRVAEVRSYAVSYLRYGEFGWSSQLIILKWYITHFPNGEDGSFDEFETLLSKIVSTMGTRLDKGRAFCERVLFLRKQEKRSSRRLHKLHVRLKGVSELERKKLIKKYLWSEPLGWYREQVKDIGRLSFVAPAVS